MSFPPSFEDIERRPRMIDTLRAEDLDTDACVWLASTVLSEQAEALGHAARRYASFPSAENASTLARLRRWYESDWFKALSCGVVDGKASAQKIIKDALSGRRVEVGT